MIRALVERPDPAFPFQLHVPPGSPNPFTGTVADHSTHEVFAGLPSATFLAATAKILDVSDTTVRNAIRKVVRREMAAQFLAAEVSAGGGGNVKAAVSLADALLKELGE